MHSFQLDPWKMSLMAFRKTVSMQAHGGQYICGMLIKPGDIFTIGGVKLRGRGRKKLLQFRVKE